MKHSFAPLLVAVTIILTSLSDCINELHFIEAPISAKINGEYYSNERHTRYIRQFWASLDEDSGNSKARFSMLRVLHSKSKDAAEISILFTRDTIIEGVRYDIQYGFRIGNNYSTNGWIEFSNIDLNSSQVSGTFEFTAVNSEDKTKTYSVTEGRFDVPFLKDL